MFASTTGGGVDIFLLEKRGSDWVVREKFGTSDAGSMLEKTLAIPRSTTWILVFMNYRAARVRLALEVKILEASLDWRSTEGSFSKQHGSSVSRGGSFNELDN